MVVTHPFDEIVMSFEPEAALNNIPKKNRDPARDIALVRRQHGVLFRIPKRSTPTPSLKDFDAQSRSKQTCPEMPPKTFPSYFAAFFLVGFVFEGLAFAVFFAALASAISANTFSIRRI